MNQQGAAFTYVDLFAGIGGFAAALDALGGKCVKAVEIDARAAAVYKLNHGIDPYGDITEIANEEVVDVPDHDVLTAGFPCQPFSKSGAQRGMDETRGTLFWNILRILRAKTPKVVILENVRNLAGPRHAHEWDVIIRSLRREGYHVSSKPAIFSPHLLKVVDGGAPQIRERVFITATYWPERAHLEPEALKSDRRGDEWRLTDELPLDPRDSIPGYGLTHDETTWIQAWDEFRERVVNEMRRRSTNGRIDEQRLPGFPIWADAWQRDRRFTERDIPPGTPAWKANFLRKNASLYADYSEVIDDWLADWDVFSFPTSRRKLEWQAQGDRSLWKCAIQLRPSGIRVKRMTHLPALVAITQTPILGPKRRRLTVGEAARLQSLPASYDFGDQPRSASLKQLGNGVNVGVVQHVLQKHLDRDATRIARWPQLEALRGKPYTAWRAEEHSMA
ncbi:DNA cytosine methyltransferase [Agrococcus jejuensis]|uniref:DNA cytosine methyltransferase n=1 Tax=Agrococcus jejuensis TaxID=399736 RepID=UPI0011AA74CB|nr:DNA cytosine methyltransferase [Agrococcus jejuensis]